MSLTGREIKDSYKDLLLVNNNNQGVDATLRNVQDGEGTLSPLKISQTEVKITDVNGDHAVIHEGNLSSNVDFSATVTATENARDAAISAKDDAEDARDSSSTSANLATTAKTAAQSAATQAGQERAAAESASTNSNVHQQNAQLFKNEAQAAKTAADLAQAAAESEAEDAALSASQALSSKNAAASSASSALTHKNAAASSASSAATHKNNAASSASSAATSATNAANSATNAATSKTNAANSASSAATSATNSANSASSSSVWAFNASNDADSAAASALAAVAAKDAAANHLATAQLNSAFNGGVISSALTIANTSPRIDLRDSNHSKTSNAYQSYLQYLDKSNSQAGYVGYSSASNKVLTVYNSVDRVNIASQGFTYNNNNVPTQISGFQTMTYFFGGGFSASYPQQILVRYSKIGTEVTLHFNQSNQNVVIDQTGIIYSGLPFTPLGVDFFGIAGPVNQGKLTVRVAGGGSTLVLNNEDGVVATQTNMAFQIKYLTAS